MSFLGKAIQTEMGSRCPTSMGALENKTQGHRQTDIQTDSNWFVTGSKDARRIFPHSLCTLLTNQGNGIHTPFSLLLSEPELAH